MGGIARDTDTPLIAGCGDACREHFQVGHRKLGRTGYGAGIMGKKKKKEMGRGRAAVALAPQARWSSYQGRCGRPSLQHHVTVVRGSEKRGTRAGHVPRSHATGARALSPAAPPCAAGPGRWHCRDRETGYAGRECPAQSRNGAHALSPAQSSTGRKVAATRRIQTPPRGKMSAAYFSADATAVGLATRRWQTYACATLPALTLQVERLYVSCFVSVLRAATYTGKSFTSWSGNIILSKPSTGAFWNLSTLIPC